MPVLVHILTKGIRLNKYEKPVTMNDSCAKAFIGSPAILKIIFFMRAD